FDNFITANVERLAGEDGYRDIQSLRNQIAELTSRRDAITTVAETVSQSIEQQNWAGLITALESDALMSLERQRSALAEQLSATGASSSIAVNLREQLANLERQIADQAQIELDDLRT